MPGDGQVYLKIGDVARLVGFLRRRFEPGETSDSRARAAPPAAIVSTPNDVRLLKKAAICARSRPQCRCHRANAEAAGRHPTCRRRDHCTWRTAPPLAHPARPQSRRSCQGRWNFDRIPQRHRTLTDERLRRHTAQASSYYRTNILDFSMRRIEYPISAPRQTQSARSGPASAWSCSPGATRSWNHLFRIQPNAGSGESYAHEGEEFLFVLRGELKIALDHEEYHLKRAILLL